MGTLHTSLILLAPLFFGVALLYSSVGFGGGSSYIALMVLCSFPLHQVAPVALICNLAVVVGSGFHFIRHKLVHWRVLMAFLMTSIPCAYLGAIIPTNPFVFRLILAGILVLSGVALLLEKKRGSLMEQVPNRKKIWKLGPALGSAIGLVSGMVGIGGGILLSPILHRLKWLSPKKIAAISCLFILCNSAAGLMGKLSQGNPLHAGLVILPLSVFVGGQIGSYVSITWIPQLWVRRLTGGVVLWAAIQLLETAFK